MHGLGGLAQDLEIVVQWIQEGVPNVYVKNLYVDADYSMTHSIAEQAVMVQGMLKDDPQLADGFIAIGFSQGGFFWRHYTEVLNDPPVRRLIAQSSPMAAFYSQNPNCFGGDCGRIQKDPYSDNTYNSIAEASWWRDPFDTENYAKFSKGCGVLDNLLSFNETFKKNFAALDQLVLTGSPKDGTIQPWQSAFFGFYRENSYGENPQDYSQVEPMEDRVEYKKDLFGLRTLHERKRIFMYDTNYPHMQMMWDREFFDKFLLKHCDMKFD